jgi:hypothetical protein
MSVAPLSIGLCLLLAQPTPAYRGHGQLMAIATEPAARFSLHAALVPVDPPNGQRFALQAELVTAAQIHAATAVCSDPIFATGFE